MSGPALEKLMTIVLRETYAFCGAHTVPELVGRDQRLHGHVWTVRLDVAAEIPEGRTCAFDHARINDVAAEVLCRIDHGEINCVDGLEAGTNEVLVAWIGVRVLTAILRDAELSEWCTLQRIVLGQFGPDAGYRLVCHEVEWSPGPEHYAAARHLADSLD